MKNITQYINESEKYEYKWRNGVPESKLDEYKSNIWKWLKTHYKNMNHEEAYIQMIKDYYKEYLQSGNLSDNKVEQHYKNMCDLATRIITKMGTSQFEYGCIGQGWFDFMNWKIEQEKKQNIE